MATKPINKTSTVKAVDGSMANFVSNNIKYNKTNAEKKHLKELIQFGIEENQEAVIKNPTMKAALEAKPKRRNLWDAYVKNNGVMPKLTPEEIERAKQPSTWEVIYNGMSPIEKGEWNAKQRKKGMNGRTAEKINKEPLVKQFRNDDPTTYLTDENQQKGMLIATLEDAKLKPQRTNAQQFYDVKIPIPTVDHSLLRNPNQAAREAALEKTRAYAFSKRPDPDENKGIGSFRKTIGRKLRASKSRTDWENINQRTYKDNSDEKN